MGIYIYSQRHIETATNSESIHPGIPTDAYIHTYIHTHIHTYIHTYIHTGIHTCRQKNGRHVYLHTYIHTYT